VRVAVVIEHKAELGELIALSYIHIFHFIAAFCNCIRNTCKFCVNFWKGCSLCSVVGCTFLCLNKTLHIFTVRVLIRTFRTFRSFRILEFLII